MSVITAKKITVANDDVRWVLTTNEKNVARNFNFNHSKPNDFYYTTNPAHFLTIPAEYLDELAIKVKEVLQRRVERFATLDFSSCDKHEILYPYQQYFVQTAKKCRAILNCDEQGLGKTVQTIFLLKEKEAKNVLIVSPAAVTQNWVHELEKYGFGGEYSVLSYELFSKADIMPGYFDTIVYDEIHYLKNPSSKRAKAAFRLAHTCSMIGLTGTPMPNYPRELYSLFYLLDPQFRYMYSEKDFYNRYCDPYYDGFGWNYNGAGNIEELQALLSLYMFRRKKCDVLDLPDKTFIETKLDVHDLKGDLEKEITLENTPGREASGQLAKLRQDLAVSKVEFFHEHILKTAEKRKIILFFHHRVTLEELVLLFSSLNYTNYTAITGKTTKKNKQKAVHQFMTDPNTKILLASIRAAGTGLTLTSSHHVMFLEYDWSAGVMSQAVDRVHRISQLNEVTIEFLVFKNSFDDIQLKTIAKKRNTIERIIQ